VPSLGLSMSHNEITALLLIGVIGAMAYLGFQHSDDRKLQTEELKKRAADDELEELRFVDVAYSKLSDCDAAISSLLERFTWQQILECFGAGVLEMELLRSAGDGTHMAIPDPHMDRKNSRAEYLIEEAKKAARDLDDEPNWSNYFQVPTTITLERLRALDLVDSRLDLHIFGGMHFVSANERGLRLLVLDDKFRNTSSRFEAPSTFFNSIEARSKVAELVQLLIESNV
jgi:hypothetical protein